MFLYSKKNSSQICAVIFLTLFFVFFPFAVSAATVSLSPSSGEYEVGDTVTVRATVSADTSLNAVSGSLLFPVDVFAIQSVSKTNSILNFWVTEPSFGKGSGVVRFEGVALGGFQGGAGTIVTVHAKVLKAGKATISFQNAQVLANDGQGTDITSGTSGATFTMQEATKKILEKEVEPTPPPAPEEPQPAPSLHAPEIMRGAKYGALAILGTSEYPKAQVLVTFVAGDGAKVFITGVADADGSFSLVVPHSLKRGLYTVSAVMIRADKTNSQVSNSIVISAGSIFSDLGLGVTAAIAILMLLVLYLLARIYFHFGKSGNISKAVEKEVRDVEKMTHKSFDILREDVSEHKKMSDIKKDIDAAEKVIEKEIRDIESL